MKTKRAAAVDSLSGFQTADAVEVTVLMPALETVRVTVDDHLLLTNSRKSQVTEPRIFSNFTSCEKNILPV